MQIKQLIKNITNCNCQIIPVFCINVQDLYLSNKSNSCFVYSSKMIFLFTLHQSNYIEKRCITFLSTNLLLFTLLLISLQNKKNQPIKYKLFEEQNNRFKFLSKMVFLPLTVAAVVVMFSFSCLSKRFKSEGSNTFEFILMMPSLIIVTLF